MDTEELYDETDRERWVPEPPKRVDAPVRTAFERDRARVVHAAATRRLAAKTQVVGPETDDFVRNRLTHSLEVAQVSRDLARALGCHPDIAETAALAHDMGHPPFGHNGETILDELAQSCGGFEGNAQTLRLLTRLESKTHRPDGDSAGLNLTRATLDACTKYPWARTEPGSKFGVYADDLPVFAWMRDGRDGPERCLEAQVMDLADDVAYSVHDVEDGVVAGRIDLTLLERPDERGALWQTVRDWYLPDAGDELLEETLSGLLRIGSWPGERYDGTRRSLAALKNLTSDLIGRFCGSAQSATFTTYGPPIARYHAGLVVPEQTATEIAVLKGVAAHWVMRTQDRLIVMERQRQMVADLLAVLLDRGADALDPMFASDWHQAVDDAARLRVVVDQVASLTDASAVAWHARYC